MVDEAITQCNEKSNKLIEDRNAAIRKIGNFIHDTCIISNDEVCYEYKILYVSFQCIEAKQENELGPNG